MVVGDGGYINYRHFADRQHLALSDLHGASGLDSCHIAVRLKLMGN